MQPAENTRKVSLSNENTSARVNHGGSASVIHRKIRKTSALPSAIMKNLGDPFTRGRIMETSVSIGIGALSPRIQIRVHREPK
jgi:hypothetical protein